MSHHDYHRYFLLLYYTHKKCQRHIAVLFLPQNKAHCSKRLDILMFLENNVISQSFVIATLVCCLDMLDNHSRSFEACNFLS